MQSFPAGMQQNLKIYKSVGGSLWVVLQTIKVKLTEISDLGSNAARGHLTSTAPSASSFRFPLSHVFLVILFRVRLLH